ncbi:MAG: hypothetical protein NVSMB65_13770 [Chloroflexota bacterium]
MFRAAIARAHHRASDDTMQRIAADPEGGLPHRVWTHGLLAALDHPLVAAMFKGQPDIFQGLLDSLDQQARTQLVDNADTYVVQNQQAGLIRADLPAPVITYLMAVLKLGIINAPDVLGQSNIPSMEDITGALSDLIRRWLEPDRVPGDTGAGKASLAEWLDKALAIEQRPTSYE